MLFSADTDVTLTLQYHGERISSLNVFQQVALSSKAKNHVYINQSMVYNQIVGQLNIGGGNVVGPNPARARLLSLIAWFCGCTDYVESIVGITPKRLWNAFKVLEAAGVYTFRLTHCSSSTDIINFFLVAYSPHALLTGKTQAFEGHFLVHLKRRVLHYGTRLGVVLNGVVTLTSPSTLTRICSYLCILHTIFRKSGL